MENLLCLVQNRGKGTICFSSSENSFRRRYPGDNRHSGSGLFVHKKQQEKQNSGMMLVFGHHRSQIIY
jgi:hypothetical protein